MTTVLEENKYYENKSYNDQYIKVMNEDSPSSTFDMGDYRYYDNLTYDEHFKKVMEANRETFDLPDGKYYENETFNSQFKNIMKTPATPPTPVPTINPTLYSATLGTTGDAIFTLANVTTLDQVKLESTVLTEGVDYTYASNTLKIPSTVYDPSVLDEEKTLTLTVNTDKTLTAVIKTVGA